MLIDKHGFLALVMVAATVAAGCSGESSGGEPDAGGLDETARCVAITDSIPPVCSLDGTERRTMSITNNCSEEIDIWWVTYGCIERFSQRLAPGGIFRQSTFVTHPWRARAVPATGEPGATKGALLKEFGAIPQGTDDVTWAIP